MGDDFTQAEIVRSLQRIEDGMQRLKDDVQEWMAELVRRDAWEQKNEALDREIKNLREEHRHHVAELRGEFRRPPVWPAVVGAIGGLVGVVISTVVAVSSLS